MISYDLDKILIAHYKTQQSLLYWGSSGYGKSSHIYSFAKKFGFKVTTIHAAYIDPLAMFIPSVAEASALHYIKQYPVDYLHDLFLQKDKNILFLDEITRATPQTLAILTELLLDRAVFGHKLNPSTLIVAASNYAEEDIGVAELPDAVCNRLTHIVFSPSHDSVVQHMQSPLAKRALLNNPKIVQKAGEYDVYSRLRPCPRQIDACARLAESGLKGQELLACCKGRIGIEQGASLAYELDAALHGDRARLPKKISLEEFDKIATFEAKSVIEVSEWLFNQTTEETNDYLVALYLLNRAKPETCRALQQRGFAFAFRRPPTDEHGRLFRVSDGKGGSKELKVVQTWAWYAIQLGKMTARG